MTVPVHVRLVNYRSGEVYYDNTLKDISTDVEQHRQSLYRYVDCFLRAVARGENLPLLEFYACNNPHRQLNLF